MEIITLAETSARHANQFTANCIVFEAQDGDLLVEVVVENWNDHQKTFAIYLNGDKVTATTNYPKAIGLALLTLNQ